MKDERFAKTVIYMCVHNEDGAMGLVVNRPMTSVTFTDLMEQLELENKHVRDGVMVNYGGPVEMGRGFVIHSDDYTTMETLHIGDGVGLTATVDVLKSLGSTTGPREWLIALGYAGWSAGQLDGEIQANGWLTVPADTDILFEPNPEKKWEMALQKIGIDSQMLSTQAGHA